ncbi:jg4559 [Pararge aegeria aegeria]|uniref:Jg4559 protein n=1 Tax=Pararge aegeria aegeria TaxID=348720 RepID=A0A8S4RQW5_9NEOP|nr:jg4559 [Pararge aegeria aegeria]
MFRHGSTSREAEVSMGGAHSSEEGWTLGSQGEWQPRTGKRSVGGPRRGVRTTLSASQVAAGIKLHKTLEFRTPYKIAYRYLP